MAETPLSICSKALVLVGANSINSFEDETKEAKVCATVYPMIKDALLSNKIWSFSLDKKILQRLAKTPLNKYKYAYSIPNDVIRIKAIQNAEVFGNELYTNSEVVEIDCQISPAEFIMSAPFKKALVSELAKNFSISLMSDTAKYNMFKDMADLDLKVARMTDSQDKRNIKFGEDSFVITSVR